VSDESTASRIEQLVAEEHDLRAREQADSSDTAALDEDRGACARARSSWTAAGTCCASAAPCGTPAAIPTTRRRARCLSQAACRGTSATSASKTLPQTLSDLVGDSSECSGSASEADSCDGRCPARTGDLLLVRQALYQLS
jgi:hypothetical protein